MKVKTKMTEVYNTRDQSEGLLFVQLCIMRLEFV